MRLVLILCSFVIACQPNKSSYPSSDCHYISRELQEYNQFPDLKNSSDFPVCYHQPSNDFDFIVHSPYVIEAHKHFPIIFLLNETASPVTFYASIFHNKLLILPTQSITLEPDTVETLKLPIPELPPISDDKDDLKLVVSANSSVDDLPKFHSMRLLTTQHPQKRVILQTNKRKYFVGEEILYRAIAYDPITRQPVSNEESLWICFADSDCCNCWSQQKETSANSISSKFVFRGVAKAKEGFDVLTSEYGHRHEGTTVKFTIEKSNNQMYKVKVQSPRDRYFPETNLELGISFVETLDESSLVRGSCDIDVTSLERSLQGLTYKRKSIWTRNNITFTGLTKIEKLEFDLSHELQSLANFSKDVNFSDGAKFLTEVKCTESQTGRSASGKSELTYHANPFLKLISTTMLPTNKINNF